ncbi:MAG: hypothetical protein RLY78_2990 [Pseudomonadota bacterium]|jgi:TonB family protein
MRVPSFSAIPAASTVPVPPVTTGPLRPPGRRCGPRCTAALGRVGSGLALAGLLAAAPANAQFRSTPPALPGTGEPSAAASGQAYRQDAARHLYASYPMQVWKGRLPPLLHGVAVVEVDVDAEGQVTDVRFKRPPAAPEVAPWIQQMIRRAAPFPAPRQIGPTQYVDVWLVHKGGRFQLDTLTEGQD